ncbi:hypothetical protein GINT2_002045 [Glugoides intestinalis]
MKTQIGLRLAFIASTISAYSDNYSEMYADEEMFASLSAFSKKSFQLDTQRSCSRNTFCNDSNKLPLNCFSTTCAYKFTELTYLAVKELLLCNHRSFSLASINGIKYYKSKEQKNNNLELDIAKMLRSVSNTVPPTVFTAYNDALNNEKYTVCFMILHNIYCKNAHIESVILEEIIRKNAKNHKKAINSICFVDSKTKECSVIDLPGADSNDRICLYLPKQCLSFEEFIKLSFQVDQALIIELDHIMPANLKRFYQEVVKRFHNNFSRMSAEKKILWFLRIKFFVFNCVGYSVSYLNTGAKTQILELLIREVKNENDAFYLAYARSLGLINK